MPNSQGIATPLATALRPTGFKGPAEMSRSTSAPSPPLLSTTPAHAYLPWQDHHPGCWHALI
eukprot:XP_001699642.1 predicted protein [Chlamydomonas reinhardtii]